MINGQLLTEADIDAAEGYMSTYVDSLTAHNGENYFIPTEMHRNDGCVLTVRPNTSQTGNMDIHLRFAANIVNTQIVYRVGIIHTSYEITPDRNCLTNFSYYIL